MGTAHSEVAGGACWHALRQAKETTLVVAAAAACRGEVAGAATCRGEIAGGAAGTARGEVAGGACWHALCRAMEITLVVAAAAGYRYLTGGRGGRLPAYLRLSKHLMQTVDFLF